MSYDLNDGDDAPLAVDLRASELFRTDCTRVPPIAVALYPRVIARPVTWHPLRPRRWCWLTPSQWACIGLVALFAGYMVAEVWGWWR